MKFTQIWIPLAAILAASPFAYSEVRPFRVVIDPGHGGDDEGTVFTQGKFRIAEKEVTLSLAHQVAAKLKSKGYSVTLTRTKDREVPLAARTALANQLKADVFISLHMNSAEGTKHRDAEGVETYFLNNATDASSKRLASLENSVITAETEKTAQPPDIALILKDLRLDANLSESKRLACSLQSKLVLATSHLREVPKRNRGVKQALFHVLLGADMPSALVEVGFLTSKKDREIALSPIGQGRISHSIVSALEEYSHRSHASKNSFTLNRCKLN